MFNNNSAAICNFGCKIIKFRRLIDIADKPPQFSDFSHKITAFRYENY